MATHPAWQGDACELPRRAPGAKLRPALPSEDRDPESGRSREAPKAFGTPGRQAARRSRQMGAAQRWATPLRRRARCGGRPQGARRAGPVASLRGRARMSKPCGAEAPQARVSLPLPLRSSVVLRADAPSSSRPAALFFLKGQGRGQGGSRWCPSVLTVTRPGSTSSAAQADSQRCGTGRCARVAAKGRAGATRGDVVGPSPPQADGVGGRPKAEPAMIVRDRRRRLRRRRILNVCCADEISSRV